MASRDSLRGLITIFTYHSHEINKLDRLKILSWIPTTTHPHLYFDILPSINKPTWITERWLAEDYGLATDDDDDEKEDDTIKHQTN